MFTDIKKIRKHRNITKERITSRTYELLRKDVSDFKSNCIWVNDSIKEILVDKNNIPDGFSLGRINTHSTITPEMIQRSLKYFGYSSEDEFKEKLSEEVLVEKLSITQLGLKYKKDKSINRRDPRVKFFLIRYNLLDKLTPGEKRGSLKREINILMKVKLIKL